MLQVLCNCDSGPNQPHKDTCPLSQLDNSSYTWTTIPDGQIPGEKIMYPARTGWICPKCKAGVSPDRETCPCSDRHAYTVVRQAVLEIKDHESVQ